MKRFVVARDKFFEFFFQFILLAFRQLIKICGDVKE